MRNAWTSDEISKLLLLYENWSSRKDIEQALGRPWSSIKHAIWYYKMKRKERPMKLKSTTGVGSFFCAAHRDVDGNLHGHTWEVTAWWDGMPNAVEKQELLNRTLKDFDHTIIPDEMAWGECMAQIFIKMLGCRKIEISRPLEKIYAVVEIDD